MNATQILTMLPGSQAIDDPAWLRAALRTPGVPTGAAHSAIVVHGCGVAGRGAT